MRPTVLFLRLTLSLGYYAVSREASLESVAEAIDCAPGIASTLLRRAERAVMEALVGDQARPTRSFASTKSGSSLMPARA